MSNKDDTPIFQNFFEAARVGCRILSATLAAFATFDFERYCIIESTWAVEERIIRIMI